MKSTTFIIIGVATVFSLSLGIQSTRAQDYKASVNAISISTNSSGGLVYHRFRNGDIIRQCAHDQGITNLTGLSLVYNRPKDELQVVTGTNNTVVCVPLAFNGGTWLSNSNLTKAERLTFVFVETNSVAGGTLSATERFAYGPSNQITFFSLTGQLAYTVPAKGTNPPVIYRGGLVASSGEGEDNDDQGENHDRD
jgi:hypothetical protein